MNDRATHLFSGFFYFLLLALLAAALAMMISRPAAQSGREPAREVLSFDMWCLEMQLYSAERCDAHRAEDVKDYEQYRATEERFQSGKQVQAARDRALQQRLNTDPTAQKPGGAPAQ
jgi:hypothetical protein